MEIRQDSRRPGERAGLDPFEIRREVLRAGGDLNAVAKAHEVTRNAIKYQLRRANIDAPLTHGRAGAEQADVNAYIKACLKRIGVRYD